MSNPIDDAKKAGDVTKQSGETTKSASSAVNGGGIAQRAAPGVVPGAVPSPAGLAEQRLLDVLPQILALRGRREQDVQAEKLGDRLLPGERSHPQASLPVGRSHELELRPFAREP